MNTLIKEKPLLTRFMALVFSFALALSMVPITALNAGALTPQDDPNTWGGVTWNIADGVLTVDSGTVESTTTTPGWDSSADASTVHTVTFAGPVIAPENISGLFSSLTSLTKINDLSNLDISAVTSTSSILNDNSSVTFSLPADFGSDTLEKLFGPNATFAIDGPAYTLAQANTYFGSRGGTFIKQATTINNVIDHVKVTPDTEYYDATVKNPTIKVYADAAETIELTEYLHYTLTMPDNMMSVSRSDYNSDEVVAKVITATGVESSCYKDKTATGNFTIQPAEIDSVSFNPDRLASTGSNQKPTGITIYTKDGKTLSAAGAEWDFLNCFSFDPPSGYSAVGTHTLTITGSRNYTGSTTATYEIYDPNAENTTTDLSGATLEEPWFDYDGVTKHPFVNLNGTRLNEGLDYTAEISPDDVNAGSKTMTIQGINSYTGFATFTYSINALDLANASFTLNPTDFSHDNEVKWPSVNVSFNGNQLNAGSDYTINWPNSGNGASEVGKHDVTIVGTGNYTGSQTKSFNILDASMPRPTQITSLELSDEDFTFIEGKEQIPTITVKDADGNIVKPANYNVKITNKDGEEDAITAGTKTVTVTANGDAYSGELTDTYEIKAAQEPTPEDPDDPKPENPDDPKPDDPAPENPDDPKPDDPAPENPNEPTPNDPQNPDDPGTPNDPQDPGTPNEPAPSNDTITMYRLYNPNNGEHFYTANQEEYEFLADIGWDDEGIGWIAPSSGDPVYRLYNAAAGEHHYTRSIFEKITLVGLGWTDEGVGWYSDKNMGTPLYRLYNPNQFANNHHYTLSKYEHDVLVGLGWQDERVSWWGVSAE